MSVEDSTLGRAADYPRQYTADVLFPIARETARSANGIAAPLPFRGVDIWTAWELTWLDQKGCPVVAVCEIRVPAESPNLIESKSLKLYLGSFAMTSVHSAEEVVATIERDLSAAAEYPVTAALDIDVTPVELDGQCIDSLDLECDQYSVDAELLQADATQIVTESLHSHLLRSLCPVTGQPDLGSLQISYSGPKISAESLLRYVVSFREHNDFHEACVERIFSDLMQHCDPRDLSVAARYQRRGGIDINPYRSTANLAPASRRLWRQ